MKKTSKVRLDVLLAERGLFPSREAARRAIMAGFVSTKEELLEKPGMQVPDNIEIHVKTPEHQYVGRGGLKLERALSVFNVDCQGKIVIDIGASTGGFTDCALQNGASHVFAVDVGYGQLAWSLRNDSRVTVMERTNFRHLDAELVQPKPNLAVMDVSFISTKLLFHKIQEVCVPHADVISLIKPQFEAGRENVGKGGIVRDPQVHLNVLLDMLGCIGSMGWTCRGLNYSPISGGDGNIEFLGWWQIGTEAQPGTGNLLIDQWSERARQVVIEAWKEIGQSDVTF